MDPRGTGALPLPPRPSLEHYHNRAKGLLKAARSADPADLHDWARRWLTSLASLDERRLDVDR
jgi:hypothetical protein